MNDWNSRPSLTFVCEAEIYTGPPQALGDIGQGNRVVFAIEGGTFSGPGLTGSVLLGGSDWALQVAEGRLEVNARYLVQSDAGGLIEIHNQGVSYEVAPNEWRGETSARFRSSDGIELAQRMLVGRMTASPEKAPGIVRLAFWQVSV